MNNIFEIFRIIRSEIFLFKTFIHVALSFKKKLSLKNDYYFKLFLLVKKTV